MAANFTAKNAYATDTFIYYSDNNSGTNWGVRTEYFGRGGVHVGPVTRWSDGADSITIRNYAGSSSDQVSWYTACVDPTVNVRPNYVFIAPGIDAVYDNIDVTCRQGGGGIYRACDSPNNKGNVNYNEICPGTPDCATNGRLDVCNDGQNYCGGNNNCDLRENYCNFSNSYTFWCDSRLIRSDSSQCDGGTNRCAPPPPGNRTDSAFCQGPAGTNRAAGVRLNWNGIAHEAGNNAYDIQLRQNGGGDLHTWTGDATAYEFPGNGCTSGPGGCSLPYDTLYEWRVRGHTANGYSGPTDWSAWNNIRTNDCSGRPDLNISAFQFPGGTGGGTVDVDITVNNLGEVGTGGGFNVRLANGNGGVVNIPTSSLGANSSRTLTFTINKPNPATTTNYTATATVDTGGDITETNEGNNQRTDAYTINATATYDINGTVQLDTNGDSTPEGPYLGSGDITTSPGNRSDNSSGTNGTFSIPNNPNGSYTLTLSGIPANYSIVTGTRNVTVAGSNQGGVNFLVRQISAPVTWSISGTVYVDDNGTPGLQIGSDSTYFDHFGTTPSITVRATKTAGASPPAIGSSATDTTLTAASRYSIPGLNGTYTVSVANLETGYVVPVNRTGIIVNGANTTVDLLLTLPSTPPPPPSTYTITGGVFIDPDLDGSRSTSPLDPYVVPPSGGSILVTGPGGFSNTYSGAGFTATVPGAGRYQISYQNPPANYDTYPSGLPSPSYVLDLGPSCGPVGTIPDAVCSGTGDSISGVNFGIRPQVAQAWIQGTGGDMRSDSNFTNIIPATFYFSQDDSPTLSYGIIFGENINLGPSGATNLRDWHVRSAYSGTTIKTSYKNVTDNIEKGGLRGSINPIPGCSTAAANCTLSSVPAAKGIYTAGDGTSTTTVNSASALNFNSGEDYLFIINGNLVINANILVSRTTTLIFIVSGNITVEGGVTDIQGIYSANRNFTVNTTGGSDEQLIIEGNVIANAGKTGSTFTRLRNLGARNADTPAVQFRYRPDFILNAPELMRYSNFSIKEVSPGE